MNKFWRLTLLVGMILAFIGINSSFAAAAITISATAPNCFDTTSGGYTQVDCTPAMGLFYGKPLDNGQCYTVSGSTSAVSISVVNADCATVDAQKSTDTTAPTADTSTTNTSTDTSAAPTLTEGTSADRQTVIECNGSGSPTALQDCVSKNPLVTQFETLINFLGIGVGVIVVLMIIIGGIQYTTAGNNPQAVGAAKKRIFNAIIAMVAFLLLYSFMQWLIPGGPF